MQHQPGGGEARRACEMESPVPMVVTEHYNPQRGLTWFGKQMMEKASVLKLIRGTEGNKSKSFFILTSQQVFYKNIKAM